jgi:demethylmenaquinone methyltransferase/2-methoxy-6-polyprenyl-1,4-benzoquinol methylase
MFARISKRYDLLNGVMSGGRHHAWRRTAARLVAMGSPGPAVDIATGTGDFALELARNTSVTGVVGLDFTREMLSIAVDKVKDKGPGKSIDMVVGDAHRLPFLSDRFICATVGFGVRNFSDVRQALEEMVRVVRPGGHVAVLEIVRMPDGGVLNRAFRLYFRYVTPWLGALLAGDREAYTYLPESAQGFFSAEQLKGMLTKAGLSDVVCRRLALGSVALLVGRKP